MDTNRTGIDLAKVRIIQNYLTKLFHDLYIGGDCLTFFVFTGDTHNGQLKFNREYLDTLHPSGTLQQFLEAMVIPAIPANPSMLIEVGADGAITITEKCSEH